MNLPSSVDTVVVGAGQSGLVMSHLLRQAGRDHVVLDRRTSLGGGWRDRWDSFCLVTPNWTTSLPGFPYDGSEADGFMGRDDIAARIASLAEARQTLVSSTVKDLVVGSGLEFDAQDTRELKGVPGAWQLFKVVG